MPEKDDDRVEGRIYDNEYLVLWDYSQLDDPDGIEKYKRAYEAFKRVKNMDIGNLTVLFERNNVIYAMTLKSYVAGKPPVPYVDFAFPEEQPIHYNEFKPTDGSDDNEGERLRRKAIWNGYDRNVAEGEKAKKLLESVIKKLIKEKLNPQD